MSENIELCILLRKVSTVLWCKWPKWISEKTQVQVHTPRAGCTVGNLVMNCDYAVEHETIFHCSKVVGINSSCFPEWSSPGQISWCVIPCLTEGWQWHTEASEYTQCVPAYCGADPRSNL